MRTATSVLHGRHLRTWAVSLRPNEAEAWATVLTAQLVSRPVAIWVAHTCDVFNGQSQVWCGALGPRLGQGSVIDIIRQRCDRPTSTAKKTRARNTWVASQRSPTDTYIAVSEIGTTDDTEVETNC